jgi:propanol-preferring alcohol dehydrogenase
MRAWRLTGWKQQPEFHELPEPDPGPGEVLVRIGGAGACHSDVHLMEDFEPGALPWDVPFTLGHENAGWVEAMGAGVSGLEVGQPVALYFPWGCGHCQHCRAGFENHCDEQNAIGAFGGGLGLDGGFAPFMLVPNARHLVPIDDLDPVLAAPLTDAGLTSYHAVKRSLHLLVPGSTAVVIGTGGVGHLAIQMLAALTPAVIVAAARRPEALAFASSLGATHGVTLGPGAVDEIREISKGRGADLVLDLVGVEATLALAAKIVRSMGHVTLVGLGGGSHAFGFFSQPFGASFSVSYAGSVPELVEVIALADAGRIRPHVQRFALEDAPLAYEAMVAGSLRGRAVIVP